MLIQSLWKRKFEWDEPLPDDIITEWCKIREDTAKATETKFSRRYFQGTTPREVTLHVFCDASTKAYGSCAYLVSGCHSTLVMAKNKVTPIKQLTVPKLELCAALIGAKLSQHITSTIHCDKVYLWSDSQIVLKWISTTKPQPQFIARRVTEIHELTDGFMWHYCPTDSNPADLLSRGLTYEKFHDNILWMHGPSWLNDETTFPGYELMLSTHTNSEHEDTNYSACMTTSREITPDPGILDVIDINRFDTYRKLIRVTAYVLRFVNNCRNIEKVYGPLESHEINAAAKHLIKYVQSRHFPDVIEYIYQNRNIQLKRPNLVRQLDLFLDDDKLIRCGGRLSNAPLLHSTRFPYLLPSKDNLTKLIILDAHVTHMHSGTESTVTYLRQIFWIPSIRQRVQKIVRSCVTCRKVTGRAYRVPDPPPLPSNRLKVAPPFTVTGIDFTGALTVKASRGELQKAYICLFTCANTRAVHLEIVPNMTVESLF
ncbi:uncharacterized protein LOC128559275 [Mercenaria mercenaria]|uniref:uncharacterized protein LOC128559275 n=1 Tax=Mercenaria mercenaria TaxID=6596 RepID=UPI00234E6A02|nr:uncharacterized protein LOC128559275 [Mercenaria mercenaria]